MKRLHPCLAATVLAGLCATGVHAQNTRDEGWYLGGSVGAATLKAETEGINANGSENNSATGYKVVGGYQFSQRWAVEAQYQDLGTWGYRNSSGNGAGTAQAKITGLGISAVGRFPISRDMSVFGKLGAVQQTFDASASNLSGTSSSSGRFTKTTPLLGIGLEYALSPTVSLRAEYEYFGLPTLAERDTRKVQANTELLSAGLIYRF